MTRSCIAQGRRLRQGQSPRGFTLVELLVVIVIIAILIAFLLPAINSAIRSGRNTAVSAEINQMQQALAQFKSQYGVHPPSRIILSETGDYSTATISNQTGLSANYAAALAQRSVSYFRRIWPRMILSTTGPIINAQTKVYDFTGTGFTDAFGKQVLPTVHGIQGAECLVFFLGGIPQRLDSGGYAVVGFAKNPQNPMLNADSSRRDHESLRPFV